MCEVGYQLSERSGDPPNPERSRRRRGKLPACQQAGRRIVCTCIITKNTNNCIFYYVEYNIYP